MASIINQQEIDRAVSTLLKAELDIALNNAVEDALSKIRPQVREAVAAKIISIVGGEYNLQYNHGELVVRVKIED